MFVTRFIDQTYAIFQCSGKKIDFGKKWWGHHIPNTNYTHVWIRPPVVPDRPQSPETDREEKGAGERKITVLLRAIKHNL